METMVELLLNADNVRMVLMVMLGYCGYVKLKTSLLREMDEKMDEKLTAFHTQLKTNDFAHLNNTIEALTFRLNQNFQN